MDFVDDVVDHLGSRDVIHQNIEKIFKMGTGADRQLKIYKETGSLVKVVDYIHDQFLTL